MILASAKLFVFFTLPLLFCLYRIRRWFFSAAPSAEKALGITLLVIGLYVGSFHIVAFSGWCERINNSNLSGQPFVSLWDFHGPRMRNEALTRSELEEEKVLLCFYYPIIRAYRLGGYYHTLDSDLPETGG